MERGRHDILNNREGENWIKFQDVKKIWNFGIIIYRIEVLYLTRVSMTKINIQNQDHIVIKQLKLEKSQFQRL